MSRCTVLVYNTHVHFPEYVYFAYLFSHSSLNECGDHESGSQRVIRTIAANRRFVFY